MRDDPNESISKNQRFAAWPVLHFSTCKPGEIAMSKSHSRRAILAGIATAPALAAPAMALSGPDPIYAAIEAHRQADAKHGAACRALAAAHESEEQRLNEEEGAACHISAEAGRDLLLTVPATVAGALAALNYVEEHDRAGNQIGMLIMRDEDGEQWGHGYDALLSSLREMLARLDGKGVL
jgi:hypothetical protein